MGMAKKVKTPVRRDYTVRASDTGKKLSSPVRLAFLSDLHCEDYGPDQQPLVELISAFDPHAVLIGGDAYDERRDWFKAGETIARCAARWKTYYTPGNHEVKTGAPEKCRADAVRNGAEILAGGFALISGDGTDENARILLCGAEDPLKHEAEHEKQMLACAEACRTRPDTFSVLMTHRPERVDEYKPFPADLILTGHAHGGQWAAGLFPNGVYGPDQGFFPKYANGEFRWKSNRMIVSRGLGNVTHVPRLGNPPEVVCITVVP